MGTWQVWHRAQGLHSTRLVSLLLRRSPASCLARPWCCPLRSARCWCGCWQPRLPSAHPGPLLPHGVKAHAQHQVVKYIVSYTAGMQGVLSPARFYFTVIQAAGNAKLGAVQRHATGSLLHRLLLVCSKVSTGRSKGYASGALHSVCAISSASNSLSNARCAARSSASAAAGASTDPSAASSSAAPSREHNIISDM